MRLSGDLVPHNWRSAFFFLSLGRCLSVKENAEITPPIIYPQRTQDFPGGSDGKMSVYDARDPGSTPGLGRSLGEGNGNPLQYYCLEKSHGQKSLVGYSPWGRKESDTTEQLHVHVQRAHRCDNKISQEVSNFPLCPQHCGEPVYVQRKVH